MRFHDIVFTKRTAETVPQDVIDCSNAPMEADDLLCVEVVGMQPHFHRERNLDSGTLSEWWAVEAYVRLSDRFCSLKARTDFMDGDTREIVSEQFVKFIGSFVIAAWKDEVPDEC